MSGITHDDLNKFGDRITSSMEKTLLLHLQALPCAQHDAALSRLSDKADEAKADAKEAFTKASNAEVKADFAKDAATGHVWTLAKIGMAAFMTAAGVKFSSVAGWFGRIAGALQHHKP